MSIQVFNETERKRARRKMKALRGQLRLGDLRFVTDLSKDLKLNDGDGYSYSYVTKVVRGIADSPPITELFAKLIDSRKQLVKSLAR